MNKKETDIIETTGYELKPQNVNLNDGLHYIEEHLDEDINIEMLADISGYAYHHFCHLFKICTGFTPKNYIITRRLHRASQLLLEGVSLEEAAAVAGYGSAKDEFCRAFKRHFGLTTTKYIAQKGGTNFAPSFKHLYERTVIGYRFEADSEADLGCLCYWQGKQFNSALTDEYNKLDALSLGECAFWTMSCSDGNSEFYVYGVPMENTPKSTRGLTKVKLPEADYALFPVDPGIAFADMCDNVRWTFSQVISEWLPNSCFVINPQAPVIEYYKGTKVYLGIPIL